MEIAIALIALTLMEIVLGIDNIVFISIVSGKLPEEQQPAARRIGLALALGMRLLLLFTLAYIVHNLTEPLFTLTGLGIPDALIQRMGGHDHSNEILFAESNGISWKDLILIGGGLFLMAKSIHEVHGQMHPQTEPVERKVGRKAFFSVLLQIAVLDIVFSLDSVITAVGMVDAKDIWIMVVAILLSVGVMLIFAEPISRFVKSQPTVKMLALSFLILIGVMLVAEGVGAHLDKGYVYFAMVFALLVEFLNIRLRKHAA